MSSYLYTTPAEIDALVEGLDYTRSYFKWLSEMTTELDALYQEIILDHYKTRTTRACATPSRPRCTTSTRPAATR